MISYVQFILHGMIYFTMDLFACKMQKPLVANLKITREMYCLF